MLEYHWKNQVQEMGTKAQNVFMDQLCSAFPRMEMLGDVRCPPAPNAFFVPKSHKRGRVFDPFGEKQPAYVVIKILSVSIQPSGCSHHDFYVNYTTR